MRGRLCRACGVGWCRGHPCLACRRGCTSPRHAAPPCPHPPAPSRPGISRALCWVGGGVLPGAARLSRGWRFRAGSQGRSFVASAAPIPLRFTLDTRPSTARSEMTGRPRSGAHGDCRVGHPASRPGADLFVSARRPVEGCAAGPGMGAGLVKRLPTGSSGVTVTLHGVGDLLWESCVLAQGGRAGCVMRSLGSWSVPSDGSTSHPASPVGRDVLPALGLVTCYLPKYAS